MDKVKTVDGVNVEIGKDYYLVDGTNVTVQEIVRSIKDGTIYFMVTSLFETEVMVGYDDNCSECEVEIELPEINVTKLWSNAPTAKKALEVINLDNIIKNKQKHFMAETKRVNDANQEAFKAERKLSKLNKEGSDKQNQIYDLDVLINDRKTTIAKMKNDERALRKSLFLVANPAKISGGVYSIQYSTACEITDIVEMYSLLIENGLYNTEIFKETDRLHSELNGIQIKRGESVIKRTVKQIKNTLLVNINPPRGNNV